METNFTPIFKGFERVSQTPLDKYSVFNSKPEAEAYASAGMNNKSPAYVGQVIAVKTNGKVNVFVIDQNYSLVGIASGASSDTSSYFEFNYGTASGQFGLSLEPGAYLKQISITILEEFDKDATFSVGSDVEPQEYISYDDVVSTELGTFTYYFDEVSSGITQILLWFKDERATKGRALLKIN